MKAEHGTQAWVALMDDDCLWCGSQDKVNHPAHYKSPNGLESIDVIEAFDLNFRLGNVVKYILRAGRKDDRKQDLQKALWYLEREVNDESNFIDTGDGNGGS